MQCGRADILAYLLNAKYNGCHVSIFVVTSGTKRIPLVLTCHSFNNHIKKILRHSDERRNHRGDFLPGYFMILWTTPEYSRILVHTSIQSHSGSPAGTYPCGAPRCRTCANVSAITFIKGQPHNITIREHYTC